MLARALAAAALTLLLAACASLEPVTTPAPAPAAVSAPVAAPKPAVDPEKRRLMQAFGGEYNAPGVKAYLDDLLVKLAPASGAASEPYRVPLLDSPVVNAFALAPRSRAAPGGTLSRPASR